MAAWRQHGGKQSRGLVSTAYGGPWAAGSGLRPAQPHRTADRTAARWEMPEGGGRYASGYAAQTQISSMHNSIFRWAGAS